MTANAAPLPPKDTLTGWVWHVSTVFDPTDPNGERTIQRVTVTQRDGTSVLIRAADPRRFFRVGHRVRLMPVEYEWWADSPAG